ncbi:MAG: insulinase family protein [Lactobacillus sp.]|nr:insulinase family protein [Lactobacillus sp.]
MINVKVIDNAKFSTAMLGCFLRLPLTQHNLGYATLLCKLANNQSAAFPSIEIQERKLSELYDFKFNAQPMTFGSSLLIGFTGEFIEPRLVNDPAYRIDEVVETFAKIVLQPSFDQEHLELAKRQLADECQEMMNDPEFMGSEKFFEIWYQKHPEYSLSLIKALQHAQQADTASIARFWANAQTFPALLLGSSQSKVTLQRAIVDQLGGLDIATPFLDQNLNVPIDLDLSADETVEAGASQAYLFYGLGSDEPLSLKEQLIASLLSEYLTGDPSSQLFRRVREVMSASYSINSNSFGQNNLLLIQAGVDRDKWQECDDVIMTVLDELQNGQIDHDAFLAAKHNLVRTYTALEDRQASAIGQLLREALIPDFAEFDRLSRLKRLTMNDLEKLAQKLTLRERFRLL